MQYCVDHPEEISKLAKVKAQVSEVKGVMMENIEKVEKELYTFSFVVSNRCNLEVERCNLEVESVLGTTFPLHACF